MARYYLAPALVVLRSEIDKSNPKRDRTSDGWIGDADHAARPSDHNPDYPDGGVVRAFDADKDGIDAGWLVSRAIQDIRTNYVIFAGYIYSRAYGFRKRVYTGANKHHGHVHISIRHGKTYENSTRPWGYIRTTPSPTPPARPPVTIEEDDMEHIGPGSKNKNSVSLIQKLLQAEARVNGRPNPLPKFGPDGDYGDETTAAVAEYQRLRGVSTKMPGYTGGVTMTFLLEYRDKIQ